MSEKIHLSSPHMSQAGYEAEFVKEAFETNWLAPVGPNLNLFEQELADYVGIKYATSVSSGTAAIHLAMKLAGIRANDIVFCQSLTFVASANPIIYEQGIPVFIDSEKETWNMDPDLLEEAFQKYPEVKAVIVVHLYGMSAEMDRIKELCRKYNTILIEDAAESLGAKYKGQYSGTHGDYGIYSFNGNKIITTTGGGMLISNNQSAIKKAHFLATQAREDAEYYQHKEIGYNYRMSNLLAGIGRGQLKVLEKRVKKKRAIYDFYKKELSQLEGIQFVSEPLSTYSNRWLSTILLTGKIKPSDVLTALAKENIEGRRFWKPMHLQPLFKEYEYMGGTVSEKLFESGVCLPSDTKMTEADLKRVVETIEKLWREQ